MTSSMHEGDGGNGKGPITAVPTEDGVEGKSTEDGEEETDLKLAWEVLELARVICQK